MRRAAESSASLRASSRSKTLSAFGSAALEHHRQKLPAHTAAASSVSRQVRVPMYGQPGTQKSTLDVDTCSSQHARATSSPTAPVSVPQTRATPSSELSLGSAPQPRGKSRASAPRWSASGGR